MAAQDSLKVLGIFGRTDSTGSAVADLDQEELRLLTTALMRPGYTVNLLDQTSNPNAFQVRQNTGADMNVKVGSGTTKRDGYVILGGSAGQGAYIVRLDAATKTVSVPASDTVNPRKYGVYLYVNDIAYSGTAGRAYANIECLAGTPAAGTSSVVPSPSATWSASTLLWSFQLAANATAVTNTILDDANHTDPRVASIPTGSGGTYVGTGTATVGPFTIAETTLVSATAPVSSTRKYKVQWTVPMSVDTTNVQVGWKITDAANTAITSRTSIISLGTSGVQNTISGVDYFTGVTTTAVRLRVVRQSGSGTLTSSQTATNSAVLIVEDIGPA